MKHPLLCVQREKKEIFRRKINLHLCNFSDFNSNLIEISQIKQYIDTNIYYCPDQLNETLTGVYEDNIFHIMNLQ